MKTMRVLSILVYWHVTRDQLSKRWREKRVDRRISFTMDHGPEDMDTESYTSKLCVNYVCIFPVAAGLHYESQPS